MTGRAAELAARLARLDALRAVMALAIVEWQMALPDKARNAAPHSA